MDRSILLVDDDADTRSLMCEALQRRGFDVEAVDSGEACLVECDRCPAAVVVTDVQMPGMSGIELCGKLRMRLPEITVIVVSGLWDHATVSAAKMMGAVTFLPKPVDISTLDTALRDALDKVETR